MDGTEWRRAGDASSHTLFIEGDTTTMIFCAALTITFELPDSDYSMMMMIHSINHTIDLDASISV